MPPPGPMKSIIKNLVHAKLLIFKGLSMERLGFFVPILGIGQSRESTDRLGK